MPTTLLFDMDDTLVGDDASYFESLRLLCRDFDPPLDDERLRPAYDALSPPYWGSDNEIPIRLGLWRQALAACEYDIGLAETVLERYFYHRTVTTRPLPAVEATLEVLKPRYRLGVVTNGAKNIQVARLRHCGLEPFFDVIVSSSDVDSGKPEPAIIHAAASELGATLENTWLVGDSLHSDIQGALNAGLGAAVWFNRNGTIRSEADPVPHHEISDLSELPGLLDRQR